MPFPYCISFICRYLWELVKDFLKPLGEDIIKNTLGLFSQPSFQL